MRSLRALTQGYDNLRTSKFIVKLQAHSPLPNICFDGQRNIA